VVGGLAIKVANSGPLKNKKYSLMCVVGPGYPSAKLGEIPRRWAKRKNVRVVSSGNFNDISPQKILIQQLI